MKKNEDVIKGIIIKCYGCEQHIEEVWKYIVLGDLRKAMNSIGEMFIELDGIIKSIEWLNAVYSFEFKVEELVYILIRLEEAIKVSDYILISDIVKYDIKLLIERWRKLITAKLDINIF